MNSKLEQFTKPTGVTNSWRFPTLQECQCFLDKNVPDNASGQYYYNTPDSPCRVTVVVNEEGDNTISDGVSCGYISSIFLRPVIDITY